MKVWSGIAIICGIINIALLFIIPISNGISSSNAYDQFQQETREEYNKAVNILSNSDTLNLTDEQIKDIQFAFMLFGNEATRSSKEKKYGEDKVSAVVKKYPDGKFLYNYVNALVEYSSPAKEIPQTTEIQGKTIQYHTYTYLHQPTKKELKEAVRFLDEIPDWYYGILADKIKHDKSIIKAKAAEIGIK